MTKVALIQQASIFFLGSCIKKGAQNWENRHTNKNVSLSCTACKQDVHEMPLNAHTCGYALCFSGSSSFQRVIGMTWVGRGLEDYPAPPPAGVRDTFH